MTPSTMAGARGNGTMATGPDQLAHVGRWQAVQLPCNLEDDDVE
jgi:hypothetical protein